MPFLHTRSSLLRHRPLVVGVLTGSRDVPGQLRRAASPLVDLVEVRLDSFRKAHGPDGLRFSAELIQRVKKASRKPILLTLRSHTETDPDKSGAAGRRGHMDDARREALLVPLLPTVAMVDVEARRARFARRVTSVARRLGVGVIHSFHDFKTPSSPAKLDRWCARARRAGADIFKAAVTPRDGRDLSKFLVWGTRVQRIGRVLIGMGAAGAPSRTMGFTFGSLLTYGHLGASTAPGQMPAAELGRAIRAIYGTWGKK